MPPFEIAQAGIAGTMLHSQNPQARWISMAELASLNLKTAVAPLYPAVGSRF